MRLISSTIVAGAGARCCRCSGVQVLFAGLLGLVLTGGLAACSPEGLLASKELPPDVSDPAATQTPAGALASYRGALVALRDALGGTPGSFVPITGLLTDELQSADVGLVGVTAGNMPIDSRRLMPEYAFAVYGELQRVRGQAREARGALREYAPDASPALASHLDAVEAYAEIFLADLFCSGIPLSTLDFEGDYTLQPGSTTEQVYTHAVTLFDSALALAADSTQILNLARVGQGRALLELGQYAAAGAVVAAVPDGFQYALTYSTAQNSENQTRANINFAREGFGGQSPVLTLVDREGGTGLPYLSSGDPRTAWVANGTNRYGRQRLRPVKYSLTGDSPIVLADGIEARLIQSEAALHAGDPSWLTMLNALRTDGTFTTQPNASDSAKTDTLWHAGTGGVAGLAPLTDPGATEGRVDLLFRERAFWLFLTGHRQGDLRRLIRQYGRDSETVYPTGAYPGGSGSYGTDVNAPIPPAERESNPRFTGCFNRGA